MPWYQTPNRIYFFLSSLLSSVRRPGTGLWPKHDRRGFMRWLGKVSNIMWTELNKQICVSVWQHGSISKSTWLSNRVQYVSTGSLWNTTYIWSFAVLPLSGKAPVPRPGYQMPEPDGCSSYFFGLPVPEGVRFFYLFMANSLRIMSHWKCFWYCVENLNLHS